MKDTNIKRKNKKKIKKKDYETYNSNLDYHKKLIFIKSFVYKNLKNININYSIEEFESDSDMSQEEIIYDSSDFYSE